MRAAVNTGYGPPAVVAITERDRPRPQADELLIKVRATTVNRTDCGCRQPRPAIARIPTGVLKPHATILGNEFAGVVDEIGSSVTSYAVGDRVFGFTGLRFGAHAEYLTMPAGGSLALMPSNLTFEQAAPATEGAHYALSLIRNAKIHAGHDVLVNGATGAIGSAAVQLLRALDVNVTATCATPHLHLVRDLGAGRVIDYTTEDFTHDPHTYDVVLDAVGKSTYRRTRRLLKPRGIYLSSDLGPMLQNPALALITPMFPGKRVKFPIPKSNRDIVAYFKELIEAGQYTPLVDRQYPFDQIVEAHQYVETGQKIGNVVIIVNPA
jgi:NADPH:quinone reductase-like Zn-dependent oxidoreductase